MVGFMQCEQIYDESCWRWLIVLIITHGCSAIIFIAVVVISKNTLKRGRVLSLTSCILTCVFVTSEARVLQTSARLSSRSRNRASQGKLSSHSRSCLVIHFLTFHYNFDASIIQISILRVIQKCTLSLNQTLILENLRVSFSMSISFFPQNSHSQLSIFLPELSFSTLKNFLDKSSSRSRLTVNLLSQKSDMECQCVFRSFVTLGKY